MYAFHDSIIGFRIAFDLGRLKEHRRGVSGVRRCEICAVWLAHGTGDGSGQRSRDTVSLSSQRLQGTDPA